MAWLAGTLPLAAPTELEFELVYSAGALVLDVERGVARDAERFASHANGERALPFDGPRQASKLCRELARRIRALEVACASSSLWHVGIMKLE